MKTTGERSAGNPHAAFEEAGAGDGAESYRASPRPYGTWEETGPKGEVVSRRERILRCRWTFRQEMEYLLELTGFRVRELYGGFSKEPPVSGAAMNLWVCEKE